MSLETVEKETTLDERWAALESNPDVLTSLCRMLGVGQTWEVVDVWGLDPDLLAFVPQPVVALVLLFPSRKEDGTRTREKLSVPPHPLSDNVYFLRQLEGHLDNACGTIAVLHALLNNRELLGLEGGDSVVERFYSRTRVMGGEERGRSLDTDQEIAGVHNSLVGEGQSRVVSGDKVCHHFVCLTGVGGQLVELDGANNSGPNIVSELGPGETLLSAAAEFVKTKYIGSSEGNIQFSLMALVMKQD